ncbi:hypothetical protein BB560_002519 [Smittium megazygosporum]|uniref:Leucine-rich repeat-containing N-terminal plant-type domain-containing protein n=1 Tax=Smittium megazygosporum TaxID=133381 RepID=A0A2T9ZER6_9FUNG|nr:hypothetical protein BB560_002519 [Smittium megazygosporum]
MKNLVFFAPNLQSLNLNDNCISNIFGKCTFEPDFFTLDFGLRELVGISSLTTISLSHNQIDSIEHPFIFSGLANIDLSNNSIASVPLQLGLITTITNLNLSGNLFRVPRRQTLEKGTAAVLQWLRDRIAD